MPSDPTSRSSIAPNIRRRTRIGIYTIKEEEFLAVQDQLGQTREVEGKSGQRYQVCILGKNVTVALFRGVVQGNKEAQVLVGRALTDLDLDWVLVVGIAGGVPHKDFTIGDVILSTEILDFQYEEKQEHVTLLHPRTVELHRAAHSLVAMSPSLGRLIAHWSSPSSITLQRPAPPTKDLIKDDVPQHLLRDVERALEHHLNNPRLEPKQVTGTVGSSNSLLKSSSSLAQLTGTFKFLLCVEMEAAGAAAACSTNDPKPLIAIRAISDIVGVNRKEEWTQYACRTAASYAVNLIKSGWFGGDGTDGLEALEDDSRVSHSVGITDQSNTASLLALRNIQHFGDTDIFPRPYELGIFRDLDNEVVSFLNTMDSSFDIFFPQYPPEHISTLSQVGYAGFRWASQLDPLYNVYLLSSVLKMAGAIEAIRLRPETKRIFSYRIAPDLKSGRLFDDESNWDAFNMTTRAKAENSDWVVKTDIADFYARVSHERLGVALRAIQGHGTTTNKILAMLHSFARGSGIGLPVGGPAARILSETYLNASDRVLHAQGIDFCRFADDYIIFARSEHEAISTLGELARILSEYDGLSLQKLKTRVMRKSEYIRTFLFDDDSDLDRKAISFLRLRLRYDPYSETAERDYEVMRSHLSEYDVLGMLATEMRKSRVHQQLTKKLIHAARYIDDEDVDSAAIVVAENLRVLLPVFTSVSGLLSSLIPRMQEDSREFVESRLVSLLEGHDAPPLLDLHRMIVVRLLAQLDNATAETPEVIWRQYSEYDSVLVQKESIWSLMRLKASSLIQPLLERFDRASPWERRALIAASFAAGESGAQFRSNVSARLTPFEVLLLKWCTDRDGHLFPDDRDN